MNVKYCNSYEIFNEIVFVKFSNCNEYFICDLDDWNILKCYYWRKDINGYAIATSKKNYRKIIFFHRLVIDVPIDMEVDHIYIVSNGVCDNRKKNLRIATRSQNCMNRGIKSDNSSGFSGVHFNKSTNKWIARIKINGNRIYLGSFEDVKDAIKVRQDAEIKYFGEYRRVI